MKKINVFIKTTEPIINGYIKAYGEPRRKGEPLALNRQTILYPTKASNKKISYDRINPPVVNSNTLRGAARRQFMFKTLEALEIEPRTLHAEIVGLLANGGNTGKGDASYANPFKLKQEMRKNMPFLDLFGGSLRSVFIEGKLRVGLGYPLIKETEWLFANMPFMEKIDTNGLLNASDLEESIGVVRFTRRTLTDEFKDFISEDTIEIIEAQEEELEGKETTEGSDSPDRGKGAIYSAETLPAGLPIITYLELTRASETTEMAFYAFAEVFSELNTVGGWKAKGFGGVNMELSGHDPEKAKGYWEYLKENKKSIKKFMIEDMTEVIKTLDENRKKKAEAEKAKKSK